jgi:hypothetical protein
MVSLKNFCPKQVKSPPGVENWPLGWEIQQFLMIEVFRSQTLFL